MTKNIGVLVLVFAAFATPVRAAAGEPLHVFTRVDFTLLSPVVSAVCGFPIMQHLDGNVNATLFLDELGNPVHEIDTSPSLRNTFFSPVTGKSVSFAAAR